MIARSALQKANFKITLIPCANSSKWQVKMDGFFPEEFAFELMALCRKHRIAFVIKGECGALEGEDRDEMV